MGNKPALSEAERGAHAVMPLGPNRIGREPASSTVFAVTLDFYKESAGAEIVLIDPSATVVGMTESPAGST